MLEEKEGLLVKVEGKVTRIDGQNIYVNDGTGESRVYTEGYIGSSVNPGVSDEWKERVNIGDTVSAIGLASEDPEGHRLRVRDSAEIVVLESDKVDEEAIEKVEEMISKLPEISKITLEDKATIVAARAAYNALTAEERALVSEDFIKMLEAAEAKIAELEEEKPGIDVNPGGGNGSGSDSGNGSGSGSGSGNGNGSEDETGKGELPETGGTNSVQVLGFGALIMSLGAFISLKKKKTQ